MNRIASMVLKNLAYVPGAYIKLCNYAKAPDKYEVLELWQHIQDILRHGIDAGNVEIICTGTENIPRDEGCLIYGNHQGLFDVVALAVTSDPPLSVVAKKEWRDTPFLKQVFHCTDSFDYLMDREDARQALKVMRKVAEDVQNGRRVVIFPEGTRGRKGNDMLPFHSGSFKPAFRAKCPVIPVALVDSCLPFDQKGSQPVTMQIHYLPAIPYEEYKDMKTAELAELVQSRIRDKIAECVGPMATAERSE